MNAVQAADSAAGQGKCIKRLVRNAKMNVKSLLSPEKTGPYTVRAVFRSVRKKRDSMADFRQQTADYRR